MADSPQIHEEALEYVGFWARVLASLADTVLILIASAPLWWWLDKPSAATADLSLAGILGAGTFAELLVNYLLPAVVVILFWVHKSSTPGKMMLGARVVDAESGLPPTPGQATLRYLGYFAAMLPAFVGILWVGLDARKQGWHDKLAGTVVVRRKAPPVSFPRQP
ncbi:RDD family protein [Chromobacterium phragmitis]|nr:RDD family protein [Chromobacterium phragmitis]